MEKNYKTKSRINQRFYLFVIGLMQLAFVQLNAQCTADAGSLMADVSPVQFGPVSDVTISSTHLSTPVVPTNYELVYILSSGPGLNIIELGTSLSFTVDDIGFYTIHTLVAELSDSTDPNYLDLSSLGTTTTTISDVSNLITTNGVCADLDETGASILVEDCLVNPGTLSANPSTIQLVTGGSITIDATQGSTPVVPANYEMVYVLTSGVSLLIEQLGPTPSFTVNMPGNYAIHTLIAELTNSADPNFLDTSAISFGVTTGSDLQNTINTNGLCAALELPGAAITVETCAANAGSLIADANPVQLAGGSVAISASKDLISVVPPNYETLYVLTSGAGLVIQQTGVNPIFTVNAPGLYTIHSLIAELDDNSDPNFLDLSFIVPGTSTANDVLNVVAANSLCADIDAVGAAITVESCGASAGSLITDVNPVQLAGGSTAISATHGSSAATPTNYELRYLLSAGTGLLIEQIGTSPNFTITSPGDYTIHTLVAEISNNTNPNFLDTSLINFGTTSVGDIQGIIAGNGLCADLDVTGAPVTVEACSVNPGSLTANITPIQLAGGSVIISATQSVLPSIPSNYELRFVLTSGTNAVIEQIGTSPSFTVTAAGNYTIRTLVAELTDNADPNYLDLSTITLGTTTATDLEAIINAGLCAALDAIGATITVQLCSADAGTLTASSSLVQLVGGSGTVSATQGIAPVVPGNYEVSYVLTSGPSLVIEQIGPSPSFTVTSPGNYTIHTVVAELSDNTDPNFLDANAVILGTTTVAEVLNLITVNGLCADLDVAGAQITVVSCLADAGSLTADLTPVQLAGASVMISATEAIVPVVPTDFELRYILTSGTSLVIEQIGTSASFTVNSSGDYTIHTLVAELSDNTNPNYLDLSVVTLGTTMASDLLNFVTGNALCAGLDISGAAISVEACTADAGTLLADLSPVQLAGGSVALDASQMALPVVPINYELRYVLSSGTGLVIEQIGTSPGFIVTSPGDYRIHALVAELSDITDPNYYDLGNIILGTTSVSDVLNQISTNGLCAAMDVAGAFFNVEGCSADAGTLLADLTPVQLAGGSITISASEVIMPVVPGNYEVRYALTSGTSLVVEQIGPSPSFTVTTPGDYTIHTVVAEMTDNADPNFLDTSLVVFGTTTVTDILNLVSTNGLCAALDVVGAPINVEACSADGGSLIADISPVQLAGTNVTISASQGSAPIVPSNYEVSYVLTSGTGLVIEQIGSSPSFTVTTPGDYTIHTVVAELTDITDPNFLDASFIVPGTTTGFDVLNFITANNLCAALDVTGAPITVETCNANAGTLTPDLTPIQLAGSSVAISATQANTPVAPTNYETVYVLTTLPGLIIQQTASSPNFTVTTAGNYTIHTLVAETSNSTDPNFLDVSLIIPGVTTAVDVLSLITNNGLCADLDIVGAPITVETCLANGGSLVADVTPLQMLIGDSVTMSAAHLVAPVIPANYEVIYGLTVGPSLIIEEIASTPNFTVNTPGDYTIHTFVAELSDNTDPNFIDVSALILGTTTVTDVLNLVSANGICADLDVAGAPVTVEICSSDAGSLTANYSLVQIVDSVVIGSTHATIPSVPANYDTLYVLSSGAGLTIEQIGAAPNFTVTSPGIYTIHTLVAELNDMADPNFFDLSLVVLDTTTAFDVENLLVGNALCADLDINGAVITVEACSANAGSLIADLSSVQLIDSVAISATVATAPSVPLGYETVYVLTSGTSLVIEQIGVTPSFTVSTLGEYTIHTLVAELSDINNPNFLDTSIIVLGTTTATDVLNLISTNNLCAAVDTLGASFIVESCLADAGSLSSDVTPVVLSGGTATISASVDTAPLVPTDYEILYVLTSGTGLVIEQTSNSPNFTVSSAGAYTIHTLLAELSDNTDPNYLDLSFVVPGATTGADILGIITNNSLCADLDVAGTSFIVEDSCQANAGSLTANVSVVDLSGGSATISASEDTPPVIPAGYEVIYVLTSGTGLLIEQTNSTPSFTVGESGIYTIHTLLAELSDSTDSDFLDLALITAGSTTANEVLDLIVNNGLCADLDLVGASIEVQDPTGIIDLAADLQIRLANNPVENVLSIHNGLNTVIHSLAIFDLNGRMLGEEVLNTNEENINMDVSSLAQGNYFLIVQIGDERIALKWLKN